MLVNPTDEPPATTDWMGLSRLCARINLQLDFALPHDWKLRLSPYFWYDFTYLIRGPSNYTREVLDEYEWEADLQDTYLEGPVLESLDLSGASRVSVNPAGRLDAETSGASRVHYYGNPALGHLSTSGASTIERID